MFAGSLYTSQVPDSEFRSFSGFGVSEFLWSLGVIYTNKT